MFYIVGEYDHLFSYGEYIDIDNFAEYDACHGKAAKERIQQLENIDFKKLNKAYKLIAKHFNALRDIFGAIESEKLGSFYNPVYYEMLNQIYNGDRQHSDIKLSDFYFICTNNNKDILK